MAPSLIGVGLFFVLPFGVVIYYSVVNNPVQHEYVGLRNYINTWGNNAFSLAARNTLLFSVVAVPLAVVLSLWLAVIMESRIPPQMVHRYLEILRKGLGLASQKVSPAAAGIEA